MLFANLMHILKQNLYYKKTINEIAENYVWKRL